MIRRSVLSLLLCYLMTACHGKAAIATGGITAGVGLIGGAGTQDSSASDGAVVLIITGIAIMVYGLATLHHGENQQQVFTGTAPPPPGYQQPGGRPYPYPGQQPPPYPGGQQPPPIGQQPPTNNPPPVPEPPLPAQDLSIADPHLKEMAIKASSAARKNDCVTAKAAAQQLPPDLLAQLIRIDGALVACLSQK